MAGLETFYFIFTCLFFIDLSFILVKKGKNIMTYFLLDMLINYY